MEGIEWEWTATSTAHGTSVYFKVWRPGSDREPLKVRFSDHSVTNADRVRDEVHFDHNNPEQTRNQILYKLGFPGIRYGRGPVRMPNGKILPAFGYFREDELTKSDGAWLSLEDMWLEKSFKYIRREWRNGRWRYWYDQPSASRNLKGGFREKHTGYYHNLRGAFDKLMEQQRGQVEDVFTIKLPFLYVDDNGNFVEARNSNGEPIYRRTDIDLVWGSRLDNVGLDHIIDKHYQRFDHYHGIDDIVDAIDDSVKEINRRKGVNITTVMTDDNGQPLRGPKFEILTPNGNMMLIGARVEYDRGPDGKKRPRVKHFILTAYEVNPQWMAARNSAQERQLRVAEQQRRHI